MSPNRQTHWLRAGAALLIGSGVMVGLSAWPATAAPVQLFADLIFWPWDGTQDMGAAETRLLAAIGGGVMLGWGVMLWQLAQSPVLHRRLILTSVITWFLADSAGSLASGGWPNVLCNLVFLALFTWPLRRSPA